MTIDRHGKLTQTPRKSRLAGRNNARYDKTRQKDAPRAKISSGENDSGDAIFNESPFTSIARRANLSRASYDAYFHFRLLLESAQNIDI